MKKSLLAIVLFALSLDLFATSLAPQKLLMSYSGNFKRNGTYYSLQLAQSGVLAAIVRGEGDRDERRGRIALSEEEISRASELMHSLFYAPFVTKRHEIVCMAMPMPWTGHLVELTYSGETSRVVDQITCGRTSVYLLEESDQALASELEDLLAEVVDHSHLK